MRRINITILSIAMLAIGWQQAQGFALLGPLGGVAGDTWEVPAIGYAFPGADVGTPKNIGGSFIGQGYRRNLPVMYYAYNESFSGFFGLSGEQAVDSAFNILNNNFTNNSGFGLDGYSSNLVEFPFDSQSFNYTAESLGLTDVKSDALLLLVEEMGLAEPERYAWTLHDRFLPAGGKCPGDELYLVVQRNYGITPSALTQLQYSPYVNNTLYTYEIFEHCTTPNPLAVTIPTAVDPFANTYTAVAGLGTGLGTIDITSPNGLWASAEVGGFYNSLTVDDVAGLRYLMSTNAIVFEDPAAGSSLEQTNFNLSPLVTQNLGALLQFAQTNPPAAVQTAFPNVIINSFSNYFTIVSNPVVFSYFTNYPGSPVGSAPVFVIGTNGYILSFQTNFAYTFGNVVIVDYFSNTPAQLVTVSLKTPVGSPVGTPPVTNTSIQNITLTNFPSGDYFTLPPGSCGFDIVVTNGSNVFPTTNVVTTATNTTSTATGFVGSQSIVYNFTQNLFEYYGCSLVTNGPAWYQGIGHMQFIRVPDEYLDSLTGTFIQPITNTYSMVWWNPTNGQLGTRIFQRIVTAPDIMFDGQDLASPNVPQIGVSFGTRSVPNWDVANIIPNLAGPGTINPPVVITYNTVGNVYGNGSLNASFLTTNSFLSQLDQGGLLSWASFDATTNPPIVYPNGTSIQNLENQLVISVSPTSLPSGTNGVAYPTTAFSATGGQPPYTWSLAGTQLPNGLAFFGGVLSGTPFGNSPGTYDFTIQLTDAIGRVVDLSYSIYIPQ